MQLLSFTSAEPPGSVAQDCPCAAATVQWPVIGHVISNLGNFILFVIFLRIWHSRWTSITPIWKCLPWLRGKDISSLELQSFCLSLASIVGLLNIIIFSRMMSASRLTSNLVGPGLCLWGMVPCRDLQKPKEPSPLRCGTLGLAPRMTLVRLGWTSQELPYPRHKLELCFSVDTLPPPPQPSTRRLHL